MNTEQLEVLYHLGRRALACAKWRWMAGMLGLSNQDSSRSIWIRVVHPPMDDTSECWPDFSDPATLGCLVGLVREATGKPHLFCSYRQEGFWGVADHDAYMSGFVTTEAAAWVEVLEDLH